MRTEFIRNGRQAFFEPLLATERIDCDTGDCDDPCPHLARWETLEVWPEGQERLLLCEGCFAKWRAVE